MPTTLPLAELPLLRNDPNAVTITREIGLIVSSTVLILLPAFLALVVTATSLSSGHLSLDAIVHVFTVAAETSL